MKPFDGKRLAALALGALLCLCQAGCSFTGLDAQNLMSPPRANLEQQGIYELLQGDSQGADLRLPQAGGEPLGHHHEGLDRRRRLRRGGLCLHRGGRRAGLLFGKIPGALAHGGLLWSTPPPRWTWSPLGT